MALISSLYHLGLSLIDSGGVHEEQDDFTGPIFKTAYTSRDLHVGRNMYRTLVLSGSTIRARDKAQMINKNDYMVFLHALCVYGQGLGYGFEGKLILEFPAIKDTVFHSSIFKKYKQATPNAFRLVFNFFAWVIAGLLNFQERDHSSTDFLQ